MHLCLKSLSLELKDVSALLCCVCVFLTFPPPPALKQLLGVGEERVIRMPAEKGKQRVSRQATARSLCGRLHDLDKENRKSLRDET